MSLKCIVTFRHSGYAKMSHKRQQSGVMSEAEITCHIASSGKRIVSTFYEIRDKWLGDLFDFLMHLDRVAASCIEIIVPHGPEFHKFLLREA